MPEFIIETISDTLKSVPILYLVYLFIEIIQHKINPKKIAESKNSLWAPALGAIVGCIPQCGFSAAYATLYNSGVVGAGTLIAVIIATSDEAIPIMLSRTADIKIILLLLICKIIMAIIAGYFFKFTVFRKEHMTPEEDLICHDEHCHEHHKKSIFVNSLIHTVKISAFIGITLLCINTIVFLIGEDRLQSILLHQSVFQPMITAALGLIPGCATSVLIVELLLNGSISFGAAIAGLSTGAGFGFIILFKGSKNIKKSLLILLCTYLASVIFGMVIQWISTWIPLTF